MKNSIYLIFIAFIGCVTTSEQQSQDSTAELIVLGTAQDAGSPQLDCAGDCCKPLFSKDSERRMVSCLGLIDHQENKRYLFDATPDISLQMNMLKNSVLNANLNGIFLTHAHIGHYTGLMYLGREAKGAHKIPVYAMPRMTNFLQTNGPWDQLVKLQNIALTALQADSFIQLTDQLTITPFLVPHRDEYSETVGFQIEGPNKTAVFIPDIDKWNKWEYNILDLVRSKDIDLLFIDATFYSAKELPNRDISEIPHPLVIETIDLMKDITLKDRSKVHFIHMNHSNPLLNKDSEEYLAVTQLGFNVCSEGDRFSL